MKDKTSINRKSNTGAVERETKVHDKEGDIMAIASRDVISIPPTKPIKDTAKVMMEHEFNKYSASYNDYETDIEKDYLKNIIISGINQLTEREADVISMLFGIGKYNNALFINDVAEKYNMSVAAANMLKKKILEKLKRKINFKLAI